MNADMGGQVWIETVLYTVIGLSIIALVLSFAYPKVRTAQENLLIEQSIATMSNLDKVITTVNDRGPGNVKTYTFTLKRGRLVFEEGTEAIILEIRGLKSEYSEPGAPLSDGRVRVLTKEAGKGYTVFMTLNYTNPARPGESILDLELGDQAIPGEIEEFVQAPTPYVISVSYGAGAGKIFIEEGVITS